MMYIMFLRLTSFNSVPHVWDLLDHLVLGSHVSSAPNVAGFHASEPTVSIKKSLSR